MKIIEITEEMIRTGGYASVTTRKVAAKAGLNPTSVHYYFKTTDDLMVAVYRHVAEKNLQRYAEAMSEEDIPLALWRVYSDRQHNDIAHEFLAMAKNRSILREEIARFAEQIRAMQTVSVSRYFKKHGIDNPPFEAVALTVILAGIGRTMVLEKAVGIDLGHDQTLQAVAWLLEQLRKS